MDVSTAPFEKPWGNYILDKIVETQAPTAISWLPQTLGWQIIFLCAVIYLLLKSYGAYKSYKKNAYRRDALKWLSQLESANTENLYQQLPLLLRKTALIGFNRADITQLDGEKWERWLDSQCKETSFNNHCPTLLYQLSYSPNVNLTEEKLQVLVSQIALWIKYHRRQDD